MTKLSRELLSVYDNSSLLVIRDEQHSVFALSDLHLDLGVRHGRRDDVTIPSQTAPFDDGRDERGG